MGETIQKLTVKMPWSQKLKHAEVSEVHARSGRFVTSDDAVLTLVSDTGRHQVRASQAGRIVMLVSSGDRVGEGDPLYILRLEEPAGAKSPGPAPESAPRLGAWRGDAPAARVGRWLGDWAWFLLAIGIYGVAA
ncbi:MAG: biotin/lipoyl-containing protein, partial [Pseudomonadota bacterium]